MLNPRLSILPLSLLLYGFFDPLHFKDPDTGLAIDPPNSYIAVPLPPSSAAAIRVGIFRYDTDDINDPSPPFCIFVLSARSDNGERTQDELNTRMRDPDWLSSTVNALEVSYSVMAEEPVELNGAPGHQFTMEDKNAAGGYEDLLQVVSIFDRTSGRVTLVCITQRTNLGSDLVSFGLIRDSITLPQ